MIEVRSDIDPEALAWELVIMARRLGGFQLAWLTSLGHVGDGYSEKRSEEDYRAAIAVGLLKGWLFVKRGTETMEPTYLHLDPGRTGL